MNEFSVVITHFERQHNLYHTLNGLARQTVQPTEVLLVNMGGQIEQPQPCPFQLRIVEYRKKWKHLPLAAARNRGAENCNTDTLMFLDVDCIPASDYCERMLDFSQKVKGTLVMGTPRYMLFAKNSEMDLQNLYELSVHHPSRPVIQGLSPESCYEMFWSLCFSISRASFLEMGGFDEDYEGYGAEDTDFALKAKEARVPFYLCDAEVYHQQHPIYVPPLNHLEPIVSNCNLFNDKWGYWPMIDCLDDFKAAGYIDWSPDCEKPIEIVRLPSQKKIQQHLVKNAPYR